MIPHAFTGDVALFLDVDGTLIDIAPHPDEVVVLPSLVRDLAALDAILKGGLALVSGRTIANLDDLFRPLRLRASGVHGAEFRFDPRQEAIVAGELPLPLEIWAELRRLIETFPGTMAENKTYTLAVHYRAAPEAGPAVAAMLEGFVERHAALGLRIMPGHFVFEVKTADFNKGLAVERFLRREEFSGRRPIFIGDDVTDWPGFAAALRQDGLAYSVGSRAPDVSGTFPDPAAVRAWLGQIILAQPVSV